MNFMSGNALDPWVKDVEASRDVGPRKKDGFMMVLGWLEAFRVRQGLAAGETDGGPVAGNRCHRWKKGAP